MRIGKLLSKRPPAAFRVLLLACAVGAEVLRNDALRAGSRS